jgi:hypothetical protein
MKRVIIICEGQTEQRFCTEVLAPYFISKSISIQGPTIKRSEGGLIPWPALKSQIEEHLKQEKHVFVTTMIDYYGVQDKHLFPKWIESKQIKDKSERILLLETAMKKGIDDSLRYKFTPYIQLHEFESLLFNKIEVFKNRFTVGQADFNSLNSIIDQYPNPELVNDGEDSAPSKRLKKLIPGYNKVVDGPILAQGIGLPGL